MEAIRRKRKWAPEEIQEIRERFQTSYVKDLADRFGVTPVQLTGIAFYYGIKRMYNWKIRKVAPERSQLDVCALMESRQRIGEMIFSETDYAKAKKLEAVYKSLNEVINKSL